MFTPASRLAFVAPLWVILTQTTLVAALGHLWSRKPPRASSRALAACPTAGSLSPSVLCGSAGDNRTCSGRVALSLGTPGVIAALAPVMAGLVARRAYGPGHRPAHGRKSPTIFRALDAALRRGLAARAGLRTEAIIIGAVALAGYLSMSVLREAYSLIEHPLGFRR